MNNKLEIYLSAKDVSDRAFKSIESRVKGLAKSVLSLNGVMVGLVGAAGFGMVVQRATAATAEMQKNASMAGVSVEAFQELSYAAGQYNITQDGLTDGLKELNLRAEEFVVTGKGSAAEAFGRLGYSTNNLNRRLKDTPGLLNDVIRRMEGMETASKIRISDEIFGGQGGEQFIAMINGGSTALAKLTGEARTLGVVMDNDTAANIAKADRAMSKLTLQMKTGFLSVMGSLAPQMEGIATWMSEWVKENQEFINQDIPEILDTTTDAMGRMVDTADRLYRSIDALLDGFGRLANYESPIPLTRWLKEALDDWDRRIKDFEMTMPEKMGGKPADIYSIDRSTPGFLDYEMSGIAGGQSPWPGKDVSPPPDDSGKRRKEIQDKLDKSRVAAQGEYVDSWALAYRDKWDVQARAIQAEIDLERMAVDEAAKSAEGYTDSWLQKAAGMEAATERATAMLADSAGDSLKAIEYATTDVFSSMEDQWVQFCTTGKASFSDFATSIIADMARIIFQQGVTKPMAGAVTSFIGNMFAAQGAAFDEGHVQAYAQGGTFTNKIVDKPTMFAHGGGFGVMGEAGPEGILPLTRMPGGNLGVEASRGQAAPKFEINIVNNTGETADATTTQQWDGDKWVIGIVLDALTRNKGGFRNTMKGALT